MINDVDKAPDTASSIAVRRLMADTGISELQAADLVALLGAYAWTSLLREARLLRVGSA